MVSTIETETKLVRDDIQKAFDILKQAPLSLNIYVEQVNTLKYLRERLPHFAKKKESILRFI